jgi:hypothetical protein
MPAGRLFVLFIFEGCGDLGGDVGDLGGGPVPICTVMLWDWMNAICVSKWTSCFGTERMNVVVNKWFEQYRE